MCSKKLITEQEESLHATSPAHFSSVTTNFFNQVGWSICNYFRSKISTILASTRVVALTTFTFRRVHS